MLSFVIPVRDDAARLARCLESIGGSANGAGIEVIVVDNGSMDGSADVAREAGATVLALSGARLGELRNRAAAAASGDILAFVDADHEIAPGWIPAALDILADESVGGAGAPCHPPSPGTWVQRTYDRLRRRQPGRVDVPWLGSGNMAVRRSVFDAAGGFDPTLETCEDVDLCRRIRARGSALVSDDRLGNIHYGDPETLGDVFRGELWRGRDNVRVSLRAPRSWRTLASAGVPVANLLAMAAVVGGLATLSAPGVLAAGFAAAWLAASVALRATLMMGRAGPGGAEAPPYGTLAVAAAYEAGRALALVSRAGHGRRRRAHVPARGVA